MLQYTHTHIEHGRLLHRSCLHFSALMIIMLTLLLPLVDARVRPAPVLVGRDRIWGNMVFIVFPTQGIPLRGEDPPLPTPILNSGFQRFSNHKRKYSGLILVGMLVCQLICYLVWKIVNLTIIFQTLLVCQMPKYSGSYITLSLVGMLATILDPYPRYSQVGKVILD